ncbi:Pol polyprotein [Plakobranchus ocellatus]|uniref:Pol polyprotein n=1 Tax=Plakobranchus ocellatus TaxID=259542 RepID=A0AAV4D9H3_9GAST|nr:Pol polyprotein [Plakobranchus ocellatus]
MDCGTRWPECSALREITSNTVANELFIKFTRLGVPKKLLSDNGQQLVSKVMKETFTLLGISQETSTPYHPQSNGMIERFNGSLKQMLRKLVEGKPATWDSFLPAVLFAYRDVQNASTGYSPFGLMYGRQVRGPTDIIADICEGRNNHAQEYLFVHRYVQDLEDKVKESGDIASRNAAQD